MPLYRGSALLAVALLILGGGIAASPVACACSCQWFASPERAVRAWDAVFVGVPTREIVEDGVRRYQVEVSAVYTGNVGKTVVVGSDLEETKCGTTLSVGKEELLFAGAGKPGHFGVESCRPSTLLNFDETAVTKQVYGEPHPPDPAAPTATLPRDYTPIAVATVAVFGVAAAATLVMLMRRRRRRSA